MRLPVSLALLALLVAPAALAVKKGEVLWVRAKDTKVLEKPQLAAKVQSVLQPGASVKWLGADPVNRQLHQVEVGATGGQPALTGYVLQANLSPNKPAAEFLAKDDGKPIDAQAFASSGAATKAAVGEKLTCPTEVEVTDGGVVAVGLSQQYACTKNLGDLADRLRALESISASVDPAALQAHAEKAGLALHDVPAPPAAPQPPAKSSKKGGRK